MKVLFNTLVLCAFCALLPTGASAYSNGCELFMQVSVEDSGDAPSQLSDMLEDRLTRALNSNGVMADQGYGQMILTGKFTDLYKEQGAGSPPQIAVHTTLTLSIGDVAQGAVFATQSFDLRGVGTSEQRAYINALKSLSPRSKAFEDFVSSATAKTIAYFDRNYSSILAKAERAASMKDFEQALYYSTFIPQCCSGYPQAQAATLRYYKQYIDYDGLNLLREAKAQFALSPNAEGAAKAYALLSQINPDSSAYSESVRFADEVKRQTKVEYDFEVHKKYEDNIQMEKQRINAAKEIGVAYGRGQKNSTTNILWR